MRGDESHLPGGAADGAAAQGATTQVSLEAALGLGDRELVAFVGGGGKTAGLQMLARELSGRGKVITTTTTGMFFEELAVTGTVTMNDSEGALAAQLREVLDRAPVAAAAFRPGSHGKVVGLPPAWVDVLWTEALAPCILVEADGSRGLPLKAFGPHEPQVPDAATIIVHVAGLDAIGAPLTDEHVHRAEVVAAALGSPVGSPVTLDVFVACLRLQVQALRQGWPGARIVTLLNKAEGPERQALAGRAAERLLARSGGPQAPSPAAARPDAIVIGSLREGRFSCLRPQSSVAAIVLAAGCSTRMGEQKVLLPLQDRSLVEWVADAALGSKADETIVVVGREAGSVRRALGDRPVTVVVNANPARGMSTSLQAGVRAAGSGFDAVVFLLGDQPFVTSALVDRLIGRFAETGKWIVRPRVGDRPAHPVLMSAALFSEILDQRGDVGGREIARCHPEQLCLVPADDPRVGLDIDTSEDYETALRMEGAAAERTREIE